MVADVEIRVAGADDAEAAAAIRAAAVPYLVGTAAGLRSRLTESDTAGSWLALVDGTPAGYAIGRVPYDGSCRVTVVVHPDRTRGGVGSALLRVAEARAASIGGVRVRAVADGPGGRDFATARGYEVGREHRFSHLDVAGVPDAPRPPAGIELRPLTAVDPRAIWRLNEQVGPDDPSGLFASQPYETWHAEDWGFPDHAADLGVAAVEGEQPVAFTHVFADRQRGAIWSAMTGVDPHHRGRGLGRLVKAHALGVARDAGITDAFTANDNANAAMLAINAWLGYRPSARAWSVQRRIGPGSLRH